MPGLDDGLLVLGARLELARLAVRGSTSSQWRICWRSPSGTPSMREMTSTGNGAEKSATASNSVASFERVEVAADDLADHRLERRRRRGA